MRTRRLKVGIMSYDNIKKYMMAIACGEYKPKQNDPKVWFESVETMNQVLSARKMVLDLRPK